MEQDLRGEGFSGEGLADEGGEFSGEGEWPSGDVGRSCLKVVEG